MVPNFPRNDVLAVFWHTNYSVLLVFHLLQYPCWAIVVGNGLVNLIEEFETPKFEPWCFVMPPRKYGFIYSTYG